MSTSLALRVVHVVGALVWVGGMLFVALVFIPVTRRLEDADLRRRLITEIGMRFRTVGWVAVGLLILSGLGNLWLRPELLAAPRLQVKLGLVVLALILSALHDFVLGPRAGRFDARPRARGRASWLARVNLLAALAIVALGLALRG